MVKHVKICWIWHFDWYGYNVYDKQIIKNEKEKTRKYNINESKTLAWGTTSSSSTSMTMNMNQTSQFRFLDLWGPHSVQYIICSMMTCCCSSSLEMWYNCLHRSFAGNYNFCPVVLDPGLAGWVYVWLYF